MLNKMLEWYIGVNNSFSVSAGKFGKYFKITHDAWIHMPEGVRQTWLLKWLHERIESVALDVKSGVIPEYSERVLSRYISAFPSKSGSNCFSAAVGAYLGSDNIIENWLNTERFFEILTHEGLNKCEEITLLGNKSFLPDDVLVWEQASGNAIHAAYAISEEHLFNKTGQFWFQPWQVITIEHIFDYANCLTDGGRICIYRSNQG
jgi:hypothetical protein